MTGTERKTFQKYYPADFDPKKLKKERGKKRSNQFVQRVMAPFNMQCNTCHEYIYKGKKFNMRRETAEGESYLGLKIFRFYFRCPNCLADISFKTDIENVDYAAEHGATRLFEAYKFYQEQEKKKEQQEEAEKNDAMKVLEKRMQMSKAEMEAAIRLGELQELSTKNQLTDPLEYLANMRQKEQLSREELLKLQEEEDEEEIASLLAMQRGIKKVGEESDQSMDDDDEDDPSSSKLESRWDEDAPSSSKLGSERDKDEPSSSKRSKLDNDVPSSSTFGFKRDKNAPSSSKHPKCDQSTPSDDELPPISSTQPSGSHSSSNDLPSKPLSLPSAGRNMNSSTRNQINNKPKGLLTGLIVRKAVPKPAPAKQALAGLAVYGSSSSDEE